MEETYYVQGPVKAIFFENPSNFYRVALIEIKETNLEQQEILDIVITGTMGELTLEEQYRFFGHIVDHPKYGLQFSVTHYEQVKPKEAEHLVKYFSSGRFSGIGEKTARTLVDSLGSEAIDLILQDPNILNEVSGLSAKKQQVIYQTLSEDYEREKMIATLVEYGFGMNIALSIYQKYGIMTLEKIEENPYQLVEDISHIGFLRADQLASQLNYDATDPRRIRAALIHTLKQHSHDTGDTYMTWKDLGMTTQELLGKSRSCFINYDVIGSELKQCVLQGKIEQDQEKFYLPKLYEAECDIASVIDTYLSLAQKTVTEEEILAGIRYVEQQEHISYGASQKQALTQAMNSPFFMITGGPGTGKTTLIKGLITLYSYLYDLDLDDLNQEHIVLAAPTGRAAKRMRETTGLNAMTIHRLLGMMTDEDENVVWDEEKEITVPLLIVDEWSMVDTLLAARLFRALSPETQLIIVGDKDQLPSVGPGQVFSDLLSIQHIPKVELIDIYRQSEDSSIIDLAHAVNQGQLPDDFRQKKKDRSFIEVQANQIGKAVEQVVAHAKHSGFDVSDIQVLAPMYRGAAGIDALNKVIQETLNPKDSPMKKEIVWYDTAYRVGDKVLQLVNNAEKNVFNGDMGIVVSIYEEEGEEMLLVRFDEQEIAYRKKDAKQLSLAYCCSIHKAQGSEFSLVILPVVKQYQRMLQRNLLYTAITRSKDYLILLGEYEAFLYSVSQSGTERHTTLMQRIDEQLSDSLEIDSSDHVIVSEDQSVNYQTQEFTQKREEKNRPKWLTEEIIEQEAIDPMIGMDGITPYDFL